MYWYNGAVAKCHGTDNFYSLPSMSKILTKLAAQIHSWECKKSCVDFGDRDLIFKVELSNFAFCYLLN